MGRVLRMVNPVRAYDWGSRSMLAQLRGEPPTPGPEAEVWMGAHPLAPSQVVLAGGERASLADVVDRAPRQVLGDRHVEQHGPRLPFLLKLLAAASPLSVQLHPSPEQAADGFAAEVAAGVPHDAPTRRYKDPHGKPELLVALQPFAALAGWRPAADARALVGQVDPDLPARLWPDDDAHPVDALGRLLDWPAAQREALVGAAAAAAARLGDVAEADVPASGDPWTWVGRIAALHPADPAVLVPLLLELHVLAPRDGLFLAAGVVHVYLQGLGVEVMGASDNVLRAGLTSKHVDVAAVLGAARSTAGHAVRLDPGPDGCGGETWPAPVESFRLHRQELGAQHVRLPPASGPQVLLCTAGEVVVTDPVDTVEDLRLPPGASAFVPGDLAGPGGGSDPPPTLRGPGTVFRCTAGTP